MKEFFACMVECLHRVRPVLLGSALFAMPTLTSLSAQGEEPAMPDAKAAEKQVSLLPGFRPLPAEDPAFSDMLAAIVVEVGLDAMTPAAENPDNEDEWASICVVDLRDLDNPRVAGWRADNFVYPASMYKMYVLGEAIRQVTAGELELDRVLTVKEHNVRDGSALSAGQEVSVSDVLRLMIQYSDNTAANESIDLVNRTRATDLMHGLGCHGSEVTRKYLSRDLEDEGYADVVSTTSSARHAATFLWAVETGVIGGGRGRGLIKGYLAMEQMDKERFRGGLPDSATVYNKTGSWNTFTSEAALIEDGKVRYILCALTAMPREKAEPHMAALAARVHALMKEGDSL